MGAQPQSRGQNFPKIEKTRMYGNKELPKEIDFFDQTTKDHFISEKKILQVSRPMSGFGDVKSFR